VDLVDSLERRVLLLLTLVQVVARREGICLAKSRGLDVRVARGLGWG
jgi:hypothetical protein